MCLFFTNVQYSYFWKSIFLNLTILILASSGLLNAAGLVLHLMVCPWGLRVWGPRQMQGCLYSIRWKARKAKGGVEIGGGGVDASRMGPSAKWKCRTLVLKVSSISWWQLQSIKPNVGPFWAWGPMQLCVSHNHGTCPWWERRGSLSHSVLLPSLRCSQRTQTTLRHGFVFFPLFSTWTLGDYLTKQSSWHHIFYPTFTRDQPILGTPDLSGSAFPMSFTPSL